ncbi:MAG: phosphoribosylformylglycinamidine cyclo-ligase [Candidatus Eremiobacteraeota bacterium]|nr:phosphoribosylformylglycinamidine cyclo-ligase [Candidatus Eremiobacteraeota bacterium]
MTDAYAKAGVDIRAGNETVARYREVLPERRDPRVLEGIGGFGGCFALRGMRDAVLVASTDGVGTKLLVAAQLKKYDTIGHDLVNHCVNDILCLNAQPLFFLDYLAVGKLEPAIAASIVGSIGAACADHDMALLGGETAEMPGLYQPQHFDLAGTIVGGVERDDLTDIARVVAGDIVIGLPSNGFQTNGYSLVRATLSPERWGEPFGAGTIGDALLAIHPSYMRAVRAAQAAGVSIHGMAHITGGGLTDNLPRALPAGVVARLYPEKWHVPPIIDLVVREAHLDRETAFHTFNMGIGFCTIVAARDTQAALAAMPGALAIGEIEPLGPCAPRVIFA